MTQKKHLDLVGRITKEDYSLFVNYRVQSGLQAPALTDTFQYVLQEVRN